VGWGGASFEPRTVASHSGALPLSNLASLGFTQLVGKVTVTDRGSGGKPACPGKWKKCRKKNVNSNVDMLYIHVCHGSCNVVVMFACTLVRSRPDRRRHWGELEPL
jgi:hypothetical protein